MLYLTSYLFGFVAIHASIVKDTPIAILTIIQCMCSTLHHAFLTDVDAYHGGPAIRSIDRMNAHILTIFLAYRTWQMSLTPLTGIVWFALGYAPWCYYKNISHMGDEAYPKGVITRTMLWHASLHAIGNMDIAMLITFTFYPFTILLLLSSGVISILGVLVLLAIVDGLKRMTSKLRPDESDRRSFPSGHAATAWYLATVYNWNPLIVAWAMGVSWSRVTLRKHFVKDVIAGSILGIAVGKTIQYMVMFRV